MSLTTVISDATGQIKFADTITGTSPVIYSVAPSTSLVLLPQFGVGGTTSFNLNWTAGTLQFTTNLANPNWQNVPTTNGQQSLLVNPTLPQEYLRLIKP